MEGESSGGGGECAAGSNGERVPDGRMMRVWDVMIGREMVVGRCDVGEDVSEEFEEVCRWVAVDVISEFHIHPFPFF